MLKKSYGLLIWITYITQYALTKIFTGDISIKINQSDIQTVLIVSIISIILILTSKNLHGIVSVVFLCIWLVDTAHLFQIQGAPKTLNTIGILTAIVNITIYIIKKRRLTKSL